MLNKTFGALSRLGCCVVALSLSGCVLAPKGLKSQEDQARREGRAYEKLPAERELPSLPDRPAEGDIVDRVMLADGGLEAAYFQWSAAIQQVIQAGTYPNTNLSLGLSYMLNGGGSAWNRTTVQISPDAMANLAWPVKVSTAARAALERAKAAGARYAELRRRARADAIKAWLDYALTAEEIRLQKQDVELLKLAEASARAAVSAGGDQRELLDAQASLVKGEDELHELEMMLTGRRAGLNAMMHRGIDETLAPPEQLPAARMDLSDRQVLERVGRDDPKLAALLHEARGSRDLIKLAKLQYLPDLNPSFSFTGSISRMVGVMASLPVDRLPALRAMVRQSRDEWRAAEALLEQARYDRVAEAVAALVIVRHDEWKVRLFRTRLLPAVEAAERNAQRNFAAGSATLGDVIESRRALLEVRRSIAEARIGHAKGVAELEAVIGSTAPEKKGTDPFCSPLAEIKKGGLTPFYSR